MAKKNFNSKTRPQENSQKSTIIQNFETENQQIFSAALY